MNLVTEILYGFKCNLNLHFAVILFYIMYLVISAIGKISSLRSNKVRTMGLVSLLEEVQQLLKNMFGNSV